MIMVDIYVPAVDKAYDFTLNADIKIRTIIEEIAEMIAQKEQAEIVGDIECFMLCDGDRNKVLPTNMTLGECGIKTGSRMILV